MNMLWIPLGFFQTSVKTLMDFDKVYQWTPAACSEALADGVGEADGHTIQASRQPHWHHPFHPPHQQHRAWLMG